MGRGVSNQTGTAITVSLVDAASYAVNCITGGIVTIDVLVAAINAVISTNTFTSTTKVKPVNTIESAKKIGDPNYSPSANMSYQAVKSILLKLGFVA